MLYSYKGLEPAALPERIRLSNGLTRTDPTTFTEEEILDAGYVPAEPKPQTDPGPFHEIVWDGETWTTVELTEEEKQAKILAEWQNVREKRNYKLKDTDWEIVRLLERGETDAVLSNYRQALRDITTQADPFNLVWPDRAPIPNTQSYPDT